ncbi:hypothetical protein D3C71_1408060 [compost metagenome]
MPVPAHGFPGLSTTAQHVGSHHGCAGDAGEPVEQHRADQQDLDAVGVHHGVGGDEQADHHAPAHAHPGLRLLEDGQPALGGDQQNADHDAQHADDAGAGGGFSQQQEGARSRKQGAGAPGDGVHHGQVGHLIAALQAQAVAQMQQAGCQDGAHDGPGPAHAVVYQHPDHPWGIEHRCA